MYKCVNRKINICFLHKTVCTKPCDMQIIISRQLRHNEFHRTTSKNPPAKTRDVMVEDQRKALGRARGSF